MPELEYKREIGLLKYLEDQIIEIEDFTLGFDEEMFLRDNLVKNASLMKLIVLGEYSARLNSDLKERFSEIQWQFIKAARNFYTHVYSGIDWIKVWEVIAVELPAIKPKIKSIIEELEKENNAKAN
jgi:uncharacterized protein with HEPN domain